MFRKVLLILSFLLPAAAAMCQTKKIAWKSHSGSEAGFRLALEENSFDLGNSNFGVAPTREVKTAQLDSLIFLTDSTAVMVTSEYCVRTNWNNNQPVSNPRLWKAGRDTVLHHPLFSRQHSLDSIRNVLKATYNFQNPVEKVVFVGYDNKQPSGKKKHKKRSGFALLPMGESNNGNNNDTPFDATFYRILAGVLLLALLTAGLIHLLYRRRPAQLTGA